MISMLEGISMLRESLRNSNRGTAEAEKDSAEYDIRIRMAEICTMLMNAVSPELRYSDAQFDQIERLIDSFSKLEREKDLITKKEPYDKK